MQALKICTATRVLGSAGLLLVKPADSYPVQRPRLIIARMQQTQAETANVFPTSPSGAQLFDMCRHAHEDASPHSLLFAISTVIYAMQTHMRRSSACPQTTALPSAAPACLHCIRPQAPCCERLPVKNLPGTTNYFSLGIPCSTPQPCA